MKIEKNTAFTDSISRCNMSISYSGYTVTDESWFQEPLQMPWSRVYYILDGEGVFHCGGKTLKSALE